jgi:hypothetical protein
MVRDAIARQQPSVSDTIVRCQTPVEKSPAAFGLLPLARGGDGDGACLIESSVRCNHCGYCLSYGH